MTIYICGDLLSRFNCFFFILLLFKQLKRILTIIIFFIHALWQRKLYIQFRTSERYVYIGIFFLYLQFIPFRNALWHNKIIVHNSVTQFL